MSRNGLLWKLLIFAAILAFIVAAQPLRDDQGAAAQATNSILPQSSPPPLPVPEPLDLSSVIDGDGVIQEDVNYSTSFGMLEISIPSGTVAQIEASEPLLEITVDEDCSGYPSPSPSAQVLGCAFDLGPDGATFDPPIQTTMVYDPAQIPGGIAEDQLVIACYDSSGGEWVILPSTVDTAGNTVTTSVGSFSIYAVYALLPGYQDIPLNDGWNLIGVPLVPADPGIEVVLDPIIGDVEIAWGYDNSGQGSPWASWAPIWGGDLAEMVDCSGYWIKTSPAATLRIQGYPVVLPAGQRNIPLNQDWNLMSMPLVPDDPSIEVVLASIIDNVEIVWGYDASRQGSPWASWAPIWGGDLAEMVDGKGYWIKMKAADTLIVNGDSGVVYE